MKNVSTAVDRFFCLCYLNHTEAKRDIYAAAKIIAGYCPFGLQVGKNFVNTCPLGFPGCGCADELMENPYLQPEKEKKKVISISWIDYLKKLLS